MIYGVGALLVLVLWIYCIVDCISTDETLVRNLPKLAWLFLVIILPTMGSIAWLVLGRPLGAGLYPNQPRGSGGAPAPPPRARGGLPRQAGPEDSPEFIASLEERRLRAWEADLRAREEELERRRREPPEPTPEA